nr:MAG TPA: hypothetical protein [Caudoviricetes sp.]
MSCIRPKRGISLGWSLSEGEAVGRPLLADF